MSRIIEHSQEMGLNEEERLQITLGLVKGQSFKTFGIVKIYDGRMIVHDVFFYE